jgi:Cdc6-like AAA superfamily ATPase
MLKDPGVFDVGWVPGDLHHREQQLQTLANMIPTTYMGMMPLRVIGPSGTGKTATVRYALEDLDRHVDEVRTAYIDAWDHRRSRQALYSIYSELAHSTGPIHAKSPTQDILSAIYNAVDEQAVVVIDEADMLQDRSLLTELHAIDGLALVLVANRDEDIVDELSVVQATTLQDGTRLDFDPYSVDALVDILRPRGDEGIYGRVDDDVLEAIASRAGGDARNAIKCLEMGARLASERELDELDRALIDESMDRARAFVRQKASERLRREEHIVYDIVREAGEAQMGEIYRTYEARVADPKSQRSVRSWLRKMTAYNLLESRGQTAGRVYEYVEVPDELIGWLRQSA